MVKYKNIAKSEWQLTEKLRRRAGLLAGRGLVLGIGDDCAIFRSRGSSEDLIFTTDLLIEDTHFRRDTHRPTDVGWKALARGLSDIAAMGGTPRFCLVSLALAQWTDRRWIDGFYSGLLQLARVAGAALAGGDLSHARHAMCDIVVCGAVPRGHALRRDGAKGGDAIYVSGSLGGSALGLASGRGAAWRRHLRPQPRLELGTQIREKLHATAAMDLSDGLSLDLRRLCLSSKLSARIVVPPVFPGATLDQALHGGEDYELLFTVRADMSVPSSIAGVPVTRIGTMRKGQAGNVTLNGAPLRPLGYDHLRFL